MYVVHKGAQIIPIDEALARIIHRVSTAAADPVLSAALRIVEQACGALGRAPCIHARLRRLATKPREKYRLVSLALAWIPSQDFNEQVVYWGALISKRMYTLLIHSDIHSCFSIYICEYTNKII